MDAVEFIKQVRRMGKQKGEAICFKLEEKDTEIVDQVEQWAKEHPAKTRQSEFLKMFPNAQKSLNGVLDICPRKFEPEKYKSATPDKVCVNGNADDEYHCDECCRDFWLKEIG